MHSLSVVPKNIHLSLDSCSIHCSHTLLMDHVAAWNRPQSAVPTCLSPSRKLRSLEGTMIMGSLLDEDATLNNLWFNAEKSDEHGKIRYCNMGEVKDKFSVQRNLYAGKKNLIQQFPPHLARSYCHFEMSILSGQISAQTTNSLCCVLHVT